MSVAEFSVQRGLWSIARDYVSLLKLRIVVLLVATAVGVMPPAAHGLPHWRVVLAVILGGSLAAGGAHAVNCWFDRDIDAAMSRTRLGPSPAAASRPGMLWCSASRSTWSASSCSGWEPTCWPPCWRCQER